MMTRIENLIDELVSDAAPRKATSHLTGWLQVGLTTAAMIMIVVFSYRVRPEISGFTMSWILFWKLFSCSFIGTVLTYLALRSAQPQFRLSTYRFVLPVLAIATFLLPALSNWVSAGIPNPALVGFKHCLSFIVGLGAVQLTVLLMWIRHGATTNPHVSGIIAGGAAGAWASFAYSMYCAHNEAFYAGTWYTLATLLLAAIGGYLAPRVCKW